MNNVVSEVIETQSVGEGFAAGLHGEGGLDVTQRQSLTIDGADGHGPDIIAVLRNRTVTTKNNQSRDSYLCCAEVSINVSSRF